MSDLIAITDRVSPYRPSHKEARRLLQQSQIDHITDLVQRIRDSNPKKPDAAIEQIGLWALTEEVKEVLKNIGYRSEAIHNKDYKVYNWGELFIRYVELEHPYHDVLIQSRIKAVPSYEAHLSHLIYTRVEERDLSILIDDVCRLLGGAIPTKLHKLA